MDLKNLKKKMQESELKVITISESEFVKKGSGAIKRVVSDIIEEKNDHEEKLFFLMFGSLILGEIGRELFKDVESTFEDDNSV